MGSRRRFQKLAAEALDSLPEWVRASMDNVEVLIEDEPPDGETNLLGLYVGVPLTDRVDGAMMLPDRITLFQRNIEREAGDDEEELRRSVVETVVHEVAHHFGIDDVRLDELGWD